MFISSLHMKWSYSVIESRTGVSNSHSNGLAGRHFEFEFDTYGLDKVFVFFLSTWVSAVTQSERGD